MEFTSFTAHNILLQNGEFTISKNEKSMSEYPMTFIANKAISDFYPNKTYIGKKIIDIGCLEGGYTVEFAKRGLIATGLEVRESNFKNCIYVKNNVNLSNLSFIHDNAWNIEKYGQYNIVFCCGLLYHLEYPKRYLNILSKICNDLLILDTNCSFIQDMEHKATQQQTVKVSPLTINEGIQGRFYQEGTGGIRNEKAKWSSWENSRSFWPLLDELKNTLATAGFNSVCEIKSPNRLKPTTRVTLVAYKNV